MNPPKLTISVPVYNSEETLPDLLESLCNQTFTDFQVMMVDNASTDGSGAVCRKYADKDSRFHYYRNPVNLGLGYSHARNVFGNSSPYWAFAPADLIWEPQFAQEAVSILDQDSSIGIAYPQVSFISEDGTVEETYRDIGDFQHQAPTVRYLNVLETMGWCTAFLGIVRYEPYIKSVLAITGTYVVDTAGDNLLLAVLSLRTRFRQIEKPLFKRRKNRHQVKAESLVEHNQRLGSLNQLPEGQGIRLPFCTFIKNHCEVVTTSSLPMEHKDKLVRQTISILVRRYKVMIEAELNRAISLIKQGRFKTGWNDEADGPGLKIEETAPAGRYRYLDFAYLSRLSADLDYALGLRPGLPGLNQARAMVLINLGRQQEALAALAAELLVNPTDRQTLELQGQLSAVIKKRDQHEVSTDEKQ